MAWLWERVVKRHLPEDEMPPPPPPRAALLPEEDKARLKREIVERENTIRLLEGRARVKGGG